MKSTNLCYSWQRVKALWHIQCSQIHSRWVNLLISRLEEDPLNWLIDLISLLVGSLKPIPLLVKVCRRIWWFPKMMVPNNHGFSYWNDHFGVFWGYHHLRKHPYVAVMSSSFQTHKTATAVASSRRPSGRRSSRSAETSSEALAAFAEHQTGERLESRCFSWCVVGNDTLGTYQKYQNNPSNQRIPFNWGNFFQFHQEELLQGRLKKMLGDKQNASWHVVFYFS